MKKITKCASLILLIASAHTFAQNIRHATVTAMSPIDNRGKDETESTQIRKLGGVLGGELLASKLHLKGTAGLAAVVAAPIATGKVAEQIGSKGPSAHYMLTLKTTEGKTLSMPFEKSQIDGIQVGSKVKLEGTGSSMRISSE